MCCPAPLIGRRMPACSVIFGALASAAPTWTARRASAPPSTAARSGRTSSLVSVANGDRECERRPSRRSCERMASPPGRYSTDSSANTQLKLLPTVVRDLQAAADRPAAEVPTALRRRLAVKLRSDQLRRPSDHDVFSSACDRAVRPPGAGTGRCRATDTTALLSCRNLVMSAAVASGLKRISTNEPVSATRPGRGGELRADPAAP